MQPSFNPLIAVFFVVEVFIFILNVSSIFIYLILKFFDHFSLGKNGYKLKKINFLDLLNIVRFLTIPRIQSWKRYSSLRYVTGYGKYNFGGGGRLEGMKIGNRINPPKVYYGKIKIREP